MMVSMHRCQCELTVQVRHIGVSNESSWGVCQWGNAAEKYGLPKIVSIQNSYSLLVRHRGTLKIYIYIYLDIYLSYSFGKSLSVSYSAVFCP